MAGILHPALGVCELPPEGSAIQSEEILRSSLAYDAHVASVACRSFYQLQLLLQLWSLPERPDGTTVPNQLGTSRFDYDKYVLKAEFPLLSLQTFLLV